MAYVKNTDQLLSHGNINTRKTALEIIEYALGKADPYIATKALVSIQGDILRVGELKFDLKVRTISVITESIVLEEISFGPFEIRLLLNDINFINFILPARLICMPGR